MSKNISNLKDYWTVWKPTQVNRDSSGVSREILVALKPFQPDLPKLLDSFSKQEYALTWKMLLAFTSIMYWWIFLKLFKVYNAFTSETRT